MSEPDSGRTPKRRLIVWASILATIIVLAAAVFLLRSGGRAEDPSAPVIQRVTSGDLDITVSAASGALRQGRSTFVIEFRSQATNQLVDVGDVRVGAAMPMPGMVMSGNVTVVRQGVGRYLATGEFGMAGAWQFTLEWDGPAGRGSASFEGGVQ